MDFRFTSEQDELRRTVRDLAAKRGTSADLRRVWDDPTGYDADLWKVACEQLGLAALAIGEDAGGVGASWVEAAVALDEVGAALLPIPLLSTVTAAAAIERAGEAGAEFLGAIAEGTTIATLAVPLNGAEPRVEAQGDLLAGTVEHVLDGPAADLLVVAATASEGAALYAVGTAGSGVERTSTPALDHTRRQAAFTFTDAPATRLGGADAVRTAADLHRVALAVESLGGARRCLELTVDYLKTRVQFGRPIGSFQALKHRAADLAVEVEAATATAYYAAWAASAAPDELPVVAPLAASVCAAAYRSVTAETIQLHGGIGFTWEHDAHLYFKRAATTDLLLGGGVAQRRLVADRARLVTG